MPDDGIDPDCDGADARSQDSGDTGDTGDTGDSGDTGTPPVETGASTDGGKEAPRCGCASTDGAGTAWILPLGALLLALRWRSPVGDLWRHHPQKHERADPGVHRGEVGNGGCALNGLAGHAD